MTARSLMELCCDRLRVVVTWALLVTSFSVETVT